MTDVTVREYTLSDVPALTALWAKTFGDSKKLIAEFFRLLPDMGTAMAAVKDGKIVGGAYVLVGMELRGLPGKAPVCGYIYAVAVEEEYRHAGIGRALVKRAAEKAREREAAFVCTLPAEESLYPWYEDILGVKKALCCETRTVLSAPLEPCMKLTSSEYMLWRETMLRGRVRLHLSNTSLEFMRLLCEDTGGGLYACGSGICTAYPDGDTCVIRELISMDPDECDRIAASVAAELGTKRCEYRLPAAEGTPYIAAEPGFVPADCVWNLSFD